MSFFASLEKSVITGRRKTVLQCVPHTCSYSLTQTLEQPALNEQFTCF